MASMMNKTLVLQALRRVGETLGSGPQVRLVIVGGAAGMLTDQFAARTTTGDVDAIHFRPAEAIHDIQEAAQRVAGELDLPLAWLNDEAGIRVELPAGWEGRRVSIGTFGRMHVDAVSRIDLMASKFLAHRPRDLAHLREMRVTEDERAIVGGFLAQLQADARSTDTAFLGSIAVARMYVEQWENAP